MLTCLSSRPLPGGDLDRKVHVVVTINTVCHPHGNPGADMFGYIDSDTLGIEFMMDILESFDASATFFVDVYESGIHGEAALREVCRTIEARGHDLELYTQPTRLFGKGTLLSGKPLSRQKQLIRVGKDLIESWTKQRVVAHRGYLSHVDSTTLKACHELGIQFDSSVDRTLAYSPLNNPPITINRPTEINGVWQIPYTVYSELRLDRYQSLRPLDAEIVSPQEFEAIATQAWRENLKILTLNLYSFCFIRSPGSEKNLIGILKHIEENPKLESITFAELAEAMRNDPHVLSGADYVPYTGIGLTYGRAWRNFSNGYKNVVVALSPIFLLMMIGVALAGITKRKRRKL